MQWLELWEAECFDARIELQLCFLCLLHPPLFTMSVCKLCLHESASSTTSTEAKIWLQGYKEKKNEKKMAHISLTRATEMLYFSPIPSRRLWAIWLPFTFFSFTFSFLMEFLTQFSFEIHHRDWTFIWKNNLLPKLKLPCVLSRTVFCPLLLPSYYTVSLSIS